MAETSAAPASTIEPLRAKCGWIITLGIIYLVAGLVALSSVAFVTVASVFLVGIMMMVAGVAEVINAFQMKSWGKFVLWLLLGGLYIVAGILTFENPLLTAAFLTLMLGVSLIASGLTKVFLAFYMKSGSSWFLVVLSGVITTLLGLMIVSHWPVGSLYLIGLFLAIDLIIAGIGWISIGLGLKGRP